MAAVFPPSLRCNVSTTILYDIAREAARLRAGYGLRVPDALLLATALREDAQAFLTNDTRLRRLKAEGLTVMVLADYA